MSRNRNPNRDIACEIYIENRGNIKLTDIASMLNEKPSNIRSWKSYDKWDEKIPKVGAPKGNKNAKGNSGGGAPKGNLNNFKHGQYIDDSKFRSKKFLSKYIPKVTENIVEDIENSGLTSLEILWINITTQWAAIIRSQKIMHVKNQKDLTKDIRKSKVKSKDRKTENTISNSNIEEYEYEIQFAWDKQATFLNSQSRAMAELRNLIKQYEDLLHKDWYLATEEQKSRIELIKAQTNKLTGDNQEIENMSDVEYEIYGG